MIGEERLAQTDKANLMSVDAISMRAANIRRYFTDSGEGDGIDWIMLDDIDALLARVHELEAQVAEVAGVVGAAAVIGPEGFDDLFDLLQTQLPKNDPAMVALIRLADALAVREARK